MYAPPQVYSPPPQIVVPQIKLSPQTAADPWQLFFTWAMLMLPWAIIGRFPAIWIVWAALINTSIALYYQTFQGMFRFMSGDESGMLWLLFLVNTLLLGVCRT